MTSRGQTTHPISTNFNRLLEGTIVDVYTKYEVAATKNVDGRVLTDRQTDCKLERETESLKNRKTEKQKARQTDEQTDRQTDRQTHRQTDK